MSVMFCESMAMTMVQMAMIGLYTRAMSVAMIAEMCIRDSPQP